MGPFHKALGVLCLMALACAVAVAQRERGQLRLEVKDSTGTPVRASVTLSSVAIQFQREFETDARGEHVSRDLPFGIYHLTIARPGFSTAERSIEIRSTVPISVEVTLGLPPVTTRVEVDESAMLLSPYDTATIYTDGASSIREQISLSPGRKLPELINAQPGWLFEANGILHPRGSENDVQFVRDGIPMTENRSPAFEAPFEEENVESLQTRTGGYPAEYGRKLGGVVEVTTKSDAPSGLHGQAVFSGGSFATASGDVGISYAEGANQFSGNVSGALTDRYLDSPVLNNFTNHGSFSDFSFSYSRQLTKTDHLRLSVAHNSAAFQVPNELVQQEAGQRQGRENQETSGDLNYSRVLSSNLLLSLAGNVRDVAANLSSNAQSTPIMAEQQRGFREGYVRIDLAGQNGRHSWKTGTDALFSNVHEAVQYQINDPDAFPPDTDPNFKFSDRAHDREQAVFAQDQIRLGNWNVGAGVRYDHYHFIVDQSAWSPRIAVSRYFPRLGLLMHASYDRVFQTPAMENLLLASSPQVDQVSGAVLRVPVPPGRANFYEIGFTKALLGKMSFTGNAFRRDWRNFSDDDVLLNTGVSFPITFNKGWIKGIESKFVVQNLGRFSGYLSYANQVAVGQGPITGGLFLGDEAQNALTDTSRFPISQDQRNTIRARVRYQVVPRGWMAFGYAFGSGLPVETKTGNLDPNFLLQQYGPEVLSRVNFETQRVKPSFTVDMSGGVQLYQHEHRTVSFQMQVTNLTNRLNVINFASLFSGTALAPRRAVGAQLRTEF